MSQLILSAKELIDITGEERQTDWYKEEMESIENISCKYETEEEFLSYCK